MGLNSDTAKWHRELEVFYQIKNSIIFEGNIYDSYEYPEGEMWGAWLPLNSYLETFFSDRGYSNVIFYNHIDGFTSSNPESLEKFASVTGTKTENGRIPAKFAPGHNDAPELIKEAVLQNSESMLIIMDMASRYIIAPDHLYPADLQCYSILQQAVLGAAGVSVFADTVKYGFDRGPKVLRNLILFITEEQNDLPSWFYLNLNCIKGISVDYPTALQRRNFLRFNREAFFAPGIYEADMENISDAEFEKIIDRFGARTEGFTFSELMQLRDLCINQRILPSRLTSVIDLYNYGIKENPWESEDLIKHLEKGEEILTRRVKGQNEAVCQSLDILKRAVSGLSRFRNSASPKGVLFFAGPTGTGKTETAKSLAELVFGDESACIRFDMSEYMHENSDQRLLGAPPGYVGYEAGGQLTNAVRKNPFSILLFDEIEKASPTILDKFLQILEDGRMTDGQGNTAYFSDCIIIFTSNLGIYTKDRFGERHVNVSRDMDPDEVKKKVTEAIGNHFKLELGRPEILNRIGENIVVFNYINEAVAGEILDARLESIRCSMILESGIEIDFSGVRDELYNLVIKNLDNGGRGINNIIEKALINPMGRRIFDDHVGRGEKRVITGISESGGKYDISWK